MIPYLAIVPLTLIAIVALSAMRKPPKSRDVHFVVVWVIGLITSWFLFIWGFTEVLK